MQPRLIDPERAQELRAAALEEAQVTGMIDDAGEVVSS
jgi:hypothetical protein